MDVDTLLTVGVDCLLPRHGNQSRRIESSQLLKPLHSKPRLRDIVLLGAVPQLAT